MIVIVEDEVLGHMMLNKSAAFVERHRDRTVAGADLQNRAPVFVPICHKADQRPPIALALKVRIYRKALDFHDTFTLIRNDSFSLGDTIGHGRPETIDAMLAAVLEEVPAERLAGHYHDTAGRALDNIDASLAQGLRVFDAAVGGLGGCPYAPGAAGNVATEKVAAHLASRGFGTGLDMDVVERAATMAKGLRA